MIVSANIKKLLPIVSSLLVFLQFVGCAVNPSNAGISQTNNLYVSEENGFQVDFAARPMTTLYHPEWYGHQYDAVYYSLTTSTGEYLVTVVDYTPLLEFGYDDIGHTNYFLKETMLLLASMVDGTVTSFVYEENPYPYATALITASDELGGNVFYAKSMIVGIKLYTVVATRRDAVHFVESIGFI